ncbi:MAG TPA: hypothetical protein VGF84_04200 [Micromonosporaceae bacterium]
MDTARTSRIFGAIGIVAAVAFIPSFFLGATPTGAADIVNGICMIIGMLGFAALYLGYRRVGAGGAGRAASLGLLLLAIGHLLILGGALLLSALGIDDGGNSPATLVFPLGGLLILVDGFIAGIAVVRARVLEGWRRWALLVTAIAYLLVTASEIAGGDHVSYALNAFGVIWPLTVLLNAWALRTGMTEPARTPELVTA